MVASKEHSVGRVARHTYRFALPPDAFLLDSGECLAPVTIAYESYGSLNGARDNAVLIEHGFTADAHAAGVHAERDRIPGWWDTLIGPGKAFDTNRYFVVASNVIGGCKGSTGPASIDLATGRPYGSRFPSISIGDMVRAQKALLDHLGVHRLVTVSGASMGGFQALQWPISYPEFVRSAIPIACGPRLTAMGMATSQVALEAIFTDPAWHGGDYYAGVSPTKGLSVARMIGHLTYTSANDLEQRFAHCEGMRNGDSAVHEYLRDKGGRFVQHFDAGSYVCLSRAIERFNLTSGGVRLADVFRGIATKWLLLSFSSDQLFPVPVVSELYHALRESGADVGHVTIDTDHGHDAFLIDWHKFAPIINGFLSGLE